MDKNLQINISNSKQVAVTINNKCLYLLDPTGKALLKIILVPMLKFKFLISDRVNLIYLRTKFWHLKIKTIRILFRLLQILQIQIYKICKISCGKVIIITKTMDLIVKLEIGKSKLNKKRQRITVHTKNYIVIRITVHSTKVLPIIKMDHKTSFS